MTSVAVFVAHPDDECLGVGGTIRRHVEAGDDVLVHIECIEGLRDRDSRLDSAQWLADKGGYDLSLGESQELSGQCANLDHLARDIIYTHHPGDLNRDHRAVAEAALVAGRFAQTIRTFETVSSTEWALTPFEPDFYVKINLDEKYSALRQYHGELRLFPHPRSLTGVTALANVRGSTVGVPAAEAFHTIRDTWK